MANKYFSYYRVSSKSQERDGVSLDAQREANQKYALDKGFLIVKEFEEIQSASKRAKRKEFYKMIQELEQRQDIAGVIFHDVDRSSRCWTDWAIINQLADDGYEIHFSRERSDLSSRGQRLTADIKAAIATDYSRNLSQEVKKGMYKRLEEGFSIFGHAPTGYIVKGKGVREVDPIMGPLVTECFQLYSTGKYSLIDLEAIMFKRGLKGRDGNRIRYTKLCEILSNKYYLGLVQVKGQVYNGIHQPLVSEVIFSKVQLIKSGRLIPKLKKNEYKFLNILYCGNCGRRLRSTTAKHKYHYYYCRNKECQAKPIREELVEKLILTELKKIKFTEEQVNKMIEQAKESKKSLALAMKQKQETAKLQIDQIKARLNKLLDKDLDGEIPKEIYIKKRDDLLLELKNLENEQKRNTNYDQGETDHKIELARLLANPVLAYKKGNWDQRRRLVDSLMKNILVKDNLLNYESVL